jgi:two-component system nitrogen regulation response regulator GlnG
MGTRVTGIAPQTRAMLEAHPWPGNVRELENTLVRAAVLAPGPTLMPEDLALAERQAVPTTFDDLALEEVVRVKLQEYFGPNRDRVPQNLHRLIIERVERPLIELALERTKGNQLRAASILGINRNTLHKKIAELKIDPKRHSGESQ